MLRTSTGQTATVSQTAGAGPSQSSLEGFHLSATQQQAAGLGLSHFHSLSLSFFSPQDSAPRPFVHAHLVNPSLPVARSPCSTTNHPSKERCRQNSFVVEVGTKEFDFDRFPVGSVPLDLKSIEASVIPDDNTSSVPTVTRLLSVLRRPHSSASSDAFTGKPEQSRPNSARQAHLQQRALITPVQSDAPNPSKFGRRASFPAFDKLSTNFFFIFRLLNLPLHKLEPAVRLGHDHFPISSR